MGKIIARVREREKAKAAIRHAEFMSAYERAQALANVRSSEWLAAMGTGPKLEPERLWPLHSVLALWKK